MASTYRILAQTAATAGTLTAIYSAPASTKTIVSTILVCNQANTAESFRLATTVGGVTATTGAYAYYSVPIAANDTIALTIGATLNSNDSIRMNPSTGVISVQLYGVEIT